MHQIGARLDPEIRAPNSFTTKYQIYICKRYFYRHGIHVHYRHGIHHIKMNIHQALILFNEYHHRLEGGYDSDDSSCCN